MVEATGNPSSDSDATKSYLDWFRYHPGLHTLVEDMNKWLVWAKKQSDHTSPEWNKGLEFSANLIERLNARGKDAESVRVQIKKPYQEMGSFIDAEFRKMRDWLSGLERQAREFANIFDRHSHNAKIKAENEARQAAQNKEDKAKKDKNEAEKRARTANDPEARDEAVQTAQTAHQNIIDAQSEQASIVGVDEIESKPETLGVTHSGARVGFDARAVRDAEIVDVTIFTQWLLNTFKDEPEILSKCIKPTKAFLKKLATDHQATIKGVNIDEGRRMSVKRKQS